jgi:hypothetical protein
MSSPTKTTTTEPMCWPTGAYVVLYGRLAAIFRAPVDDA